MVNWPGENPVSRTPQHGFSLLEVLVAFSILALSLGVLMQIFSGSLRNAGASRDQAQAVALAQSLLASTGVETRLVAGESSGDVDGRLRWRVRATPFQGEMPGGNAMTQPGTLELWEVMAEVSWGGDVERAARTLSFSTLRIQVPAAP